ncbi:MAG: QueT transporter family protein [Oscillospiraceae bacterium]|nr:QueT transporter family protein [Oscillospiraceae bacterium]MDD4413247.1 QueT transporter family protein [Oscillospiraceae bacterium]
MKPKMNQQRKSLRKLAEGGIIAALYTALTLSIPVASFGLTQLRVAEALTILPVFTPSAIPGLAVGCMVSNLFGLAIGANIAGAWDVLFGSLATLLAAWMTYSLRKIRIKGLPVLSTLPPIIINAAVVGLELTINIMGFSWYKYFTTALYVASGQFIACSVFGLLLYSALNRSGAAEIIFK